MIFHLSVPAQNPERVANTLARLIGGRDFAFHPVEGGRIVLFGDGHGSAIEVYPDTIALEMGEATLEPRTTDAAAHCTTHAAIATPLPAREVIEICEEAGWTARSCDRGPFRLVEVWAENRQLFELLPPEAQADYRRAMTFENWEEWS